MKLVCSYFRCRWCGDESEALTAPNPFIEHDILTACPKCRDQTLVVACDEPGCSEPQTCGTPTPTGYRLTCYKHMPKK